MYKYKNVIFEDVELKTEDGLNDWSGICQECIDRYNIDKNKLDDAGQGCCMVLGCENDADYYIDFEDGEIQEINEAFYCDLKKYCKITR